MIKSLLIKNYALIQQLKMDPSPHFNTVTGETGAGKSIMLGALGMLLGNRADTRVLFEEDEKCVIEGTFELSQQNLQNLFSALDLDYANESIIRREISPAGKSRAFVNDTPVTLDVLKSIGSFLVDVHSQRDTYLLGASSYQLRMIDGYAQNTDLVEAYKTIYKNFRKLESAYQELRQQSEGLNKESDYNHFLLDELEKAALKSGELEALEEEQKIIEHAEEIKSRLFESQELLDNAEFSINSSLQQVFKNISQVSQYAEHFSPLKSRIESCLLELKDITKEIDAEAQKVEFDPERQEIVQNRLGLLFQLLQKHHVQNDEELLKIATELREKVNKVSNIDAELEQAKHEMDRVHSALMQAGEKLSKSRSVVFASFQKELQALLKELAMPFAKIDIQHQRIEPSENGLDKIVLMFSANAGVVPDELKNVASGGEFSRLMFCIKYMLAGKTSLPTIIFDEIDTGISGEIALKMVAMMKEMAQRHQVVAITHLPQIAASGNEHYFVYKENLKGKSLSKIRKLQHEERETEIAKMIGGDHPSAAALQSARELLNR